MSATKGNITVDLRLMEPLPAAEDYSLYQHKKFQWRSRAMPASSDKDKSDPDVVLHPIEITVELENQQVQNPGERPGTKQYFCPYCGKGYADRSSQRRHLKTHDPNAKKFECSVCRQNDQFQKSNWRAHVATHIGEDIPPEVFKTLDSETIAILDGTDPYLTPKMLEYRLARAEVKKRRTSMSESSAVKRIRLSQSFTDLLYPICILQD